MSNAAALPKENICVGLLAHVDAGKTTLSEAMLYLSGQLRKLGRVDHRDSFLDTHRLERERGITIFSKQAVVELAKHTVTLMDTPGHVDFAAETERTLGVLDCAVLIISGLDGVQAHTETLWRLLKRNGVPCFVFVTKMDLSVRPREELLAELQTRLDERCVDFSRRDETFREQIALCDEAMMDRILSGGEPSDEELSGLIARRALFPCFFGSGLRLDGVEELLQAIDALTPLRERKEAFAARVFKVAHDPQGTRLCFLKLLGGELATRQTLRYRGADGQEREEKITQLRLYSGAKFDAVERAFPGQVVAAAGLSDIRPGQGLGAAADAPAAELEAVMGYRVVPPAGVDPVQMLPKLQLLQEEDPQLCVAWNERKKQIELRLMGQVQREVIERLVKDRFDWAITLDAGHVLYRETIAERVEGVGHFEPLRHYAEVHLILEPLPRGSGLVFDTVCSEDALDRSWQRLILTHLAEKTHLGVLTGAPITDMKITLAAGRAHIKHTEGGDFREATYRAVRQGLMRAKSVLLEPWYAFTIELPGENIGRAMSDIREKHGSFDAPQSNGETACLRGSVPCAAMGGYAEELMSYSRGRGRISLRPDGYRPCRDQAAVVAAAGYDPTSDTDNTPDSVFCAHGDGFTVKWNEVENYMHLESCLRAPSEAPQLRQRAFLSIDERELEAIMEREFGPIRRPQYSAGIKNEAVASAPAASRRAYLIVDGYNLIFAWDELKALAAERLDLARGRLMDMLSSYCGFTKSELVLVFDGYRTPGNPGTREDYHNIHVVFTPAGETGDMYIERLADEIGKNYDVRVVTSDNLIRLSALRSGVLRTGSKEFAGEVEWVLGQIDEVLKKSNQGAHQTKLKDGRL